MDKKSTIISKKSSNFAHSIKKLRYEKDLIWGNQSPVFV